MAEGGEQQSSFIVVDVNCDLKDFESEDSVYQSTKSYLEDIQRSGGGKIASGGFVRNPKSQQLQYVAHYANLKSVDRVLKRHEHCLKVNEKNLVLTVRPCPPDLKKILEDKTPSSDGEGEDVGSSSNGESSAAEEGGEPMGQNSSGSSDIEVISHEGANGFTIVDLSKGSTQSSGDTPTKPQQSATQPCAIFKGAATPRSPDSSLCSTPESFDDLSTKHLDQWSRSIIIENVPEDTFPALRLLLENKTNGGGNIITYEREPTSNQVLATFEDLKVAERLLAGKKLNVLKQTFSVRRPLIREELKDASTEDLADKNSETASVPDTEVKRTGATAAEPLPEEREDAAQNEVPENKDNEDTQYQEKPGRVGREKEEDEEQDKGKEEEKLKEVEVKRDEKQTEDEEEKKEIQTKDKLQNAEKERREEQDRKEKFTIPTEGEKRRKDEVEKQGKNKAKEIDDDDDECKNKGKTSRELDAVAAAKEEEAERKGEANGEADQSSLDKDSLNPDKIIKENTVTIGKIKAYDRDETKEKPTPKSEETTQGELENAEFELLNAPLDATKEPQRKDDTPLKSDTSENEPSSSLEASEAPKSIIVKGVTSELVDAVEVYLETPKKGGGPIKQFDFIKSDGEASVIFEDEEVAAKFLRLESFTIFGNTLYIWSPERKKMEEVKQKSLEAQSLESQEEADKAGRTVEVHGVDSSEVAELIVGLMSNRRKGGGFIESDLLAENSRILTVQFQDKKIADRFLAQKSISMVGKSYAIRAPAKEEPKTDSIPSEEVEKAEEEDKEAEERNRTVEMHEVQSQEPKTGRIPSEEVEEIEDRKMEEQSRTVEVHGVKSRDVAETIVAVLENKRKGGGPVEDEFLNESRGILTVRFQDKKYAEHFLRLEAILAFGVTYYIRTPCSSDLQPKIATTPSEKLQDEETSDHDKSSDDEKDKLKDKRESEVPGFREEPMEKPEETFGKPQEGLREDVEDPCVIEVQGIPDNATDAVVTLIFENKKYCSIDDIKVDTIQMFEGGRALLTISKPQLAEALIDKGCIKYKNHTLVISRPLKPEPAEELKEAMQRPSLYEGTNETTGRNAAALEHLTSNDATIEVRNIPEDMTEDTLQMIFESNRFGGGGEVTNIAYEKERGSAVITLSDPEVANRLVHQESVIYKKSRLTVTRHVEAERNQKPFPSRKRRNVSVSEEEEPVSSDRTIKISNIPSDFKKQTLEMIIESKRYGGGETESIVYDQGQGTAVITFKDPEVARALIKKEVVVYKDNQFTISRPVEEPIKEVKEDQTSSVSSRTVDVNEIPPEMTKDLLVMLLENNSNGDVESIEYNEKHINAVATFTDSVAANILVSKKFVVYKGKRLLVTRHLEKVGKSKNIPKEKQEQPAASNRMIFVSHIAQNQSIDHLLMIFESRRNDGGKIQDIDYDQEERTAVITFEDPRIAASFLEKEVVEFKGQHMLVTAHQDQASDAKHGEDSFHDNSSAKLQPCAKLAVSGDFNTIKVSGIPQDVSKDMISMYFENKKRSGGGKLEVLEHQKAKGKAVIKFDESEDALGVCKRSHILSGATLKICALEMPLDDVKSCAIEVKGLGKSATENFLELYFENTARSGGGPVEKVFLNEEVRSAIIVFEEATAVTGVMKKKSHKLAGSSFEVNVLEPAPPPPLLLEDVDAKRLLAKRLPPLITMEDLRKYLTPAAKAKMVGWTLAVKRSTALLDFSSEPDYLSIRHLISSKPFLGKMISIRRVPHTSSILVTGIPSSITTDFVAMYFENPRNGGTGEECRVEMLPDKGSAIVKFERQDIIDAITSRQHHFEKKQVKVEPYYPWLGRISISESSGTVPVKTKSEIPTSGIFPFDAKAVHFIQSHPELQKNIEESLEKLNCRISWPSEGKGEVKLEFKGKEKQKPTVGWDTECEKVLQRYTDELTWKKDNILQELWNDFKRKIKEETAKKSKLLDVAFENDQCEIQYIGLKKDTDEFEKIFRKIKGELEEELEQRKKRISENVTNFKQHQFALIGTEEFQKNLKQEFPNVDFEMKTTGVKLFGMPDDVKKAKLFLYEKVATFAQDSFEVSETMSKLYAKDEARPYLMEQLLNQGISASWTCNDRSVAVFAFDDKNLKRAIEVLKKEVVDMPIQLSKASEALVQSSQWKDFVESLCNDNKSLEVALMGPTVVAVCTRNIMEDVRKRLNGFIDKHAVLEKFFPMDLGVVDVITKYLKEDLQKIKAELKECSGNIDTSKDEPGFIINGNETGVGKAEKDLLKLVERIVMYDHDIDRPGLPAYFYSKHGIEVLRGIQMNHKASIQLDNSQVRVQPQAVAGDSSERCRVEVRPGKFMILMCGDITKCRVDAIVNAANEDLKHYGGVAAAIAEAAGFALVEDCLERIKLEGKLLPGQACVTRAGKLPCKKVIHAVGPRWNGGNEDEENILLMAVDSSLIKADGESFKSVAMPSISTGIFGFPLDRATDIIVDAVKSYFVDNSSTTVREVFFIDNDSRAVASLERKLRTIQAEGPPQHPESRSEGGKSRRVTTQSTDSRSPTHKGPPKAPPNTNPRGFTAARSSGFQQVSSDVIQTAEGVKVTLVKGSISTLKADVLVNTTGKELNLSHGNVSKSLLDAAGPTLQAEVDAKKPRDFDYGQIVVTGGHKLRCKHVYHGSCRGWDNGAGNCERIVRTFMKNLLEKADSDKQKSIAIPAIGTGNLKIPHKIVAEIMYNEVEKFSSVRKPMNLLDVQFVVYDKDRDSIKAFEDKIRDLIRVGGSGGAAAASYAPTSQMASSAASYTPSTSASSRSSSGPDFSFDPATKIIRIGSIEMTLKSGDITRERADAIVNSTNEKMDMTGGAVAKAILRAGGRAVEAECQRAKMSSRKVCVTTGGSLPAKYIIHLVAGYSPAAWQDVIQNTLEEADDRSFKDIVFPMLGTGQIGASASLMANLMVDAVCEFCKTKRPKSLKEIRVCIFQPSMLDEFVDAVARRGQSSRRFVDQAKEYSAGATQRTRTITGPPKQSQEQHKERQPQHLSRIILSIYALSKKAIDEVLKDIEEVIKEYIIDKVLEGSQDQESIAKLNPEQIQRIKQMTEIFPVQIEVETGRLKRIRIRGPPMEVTSVIDQVHAIFQEAHKEEIKKKEEKWIATVAQWEYQDGNDFENYPEEINAIIEKAFRDKKPYAEWEEQDAKYRLTFQKMVEEFMTKAGTAPVKVRRVTKEMDVPANWERMNNDEVFKRIQLSARDQEYKDVEKAVLSTAQTTVNQIVKIERIQNKMLYKQYVVRKAAMDAANPGVQNEMTLWHGTAADPLESINRTGFNRSYCGKNAVVYGRGVYFAKNFSYSAQNTYSPPDTNGYKHIYQCKVLTGEYAVGNQNMIVPPSKPSNAALKYDSTVDNVTTPTIFVIFYDTQAYPEYLIYFK